MQMLLSFVIQHNERFTNQGPIHYQMIDILGLSCCKVIDWIGEGTQTYQSPLAGKTDQVLTSNTNCDRGFVSFPLHVVWLMGIWKGWEGHLKADCELFQSWVRDCVKG